MRYRDVERRLATLEQDEEARSDRLRERVVAALTGEQYAIFAGYVKRWALDTTLLPTREEFEVIQQADMLAHADHEFRLVDCCGICAWTYYDDMASFMEMWCAPRTAT